MAHDAELLALELRDRSPDEIYRLAFSRLLRRDPRPALRSDRFPRRGAMLGTDERDLFVPVVAEHLRAAPGPLRILDVGAGDGQTFALFAPDVPAGSAVWGVEPNEAYARQYAERLAGLPLASAQCDAAPFWEWSDRADGAGPLDLVLMLHSLYFLGPTEPLLRRVRAHLAPGGHAIVVFADEILGYTGRCVTEALGQDPAHEARRALLHDRHAHLLSDAAASRLAPLGLELVAGEYQTSRLYGHTLRDLLALGLITDLAFADSLPLERRIAAVARQLSEEPEAVGLSVEEEEPRIGMLSVLEPQVVAVLRAQ